jgi:hypothetical protein
MSLFLLESVLLSKKQELLNVPTVQILWNIYSYSVLEVSTGLLGYGLINVFLESLAG